MNFLGNNSELYLLRPETLTRNRFLYFVYRLRAIKRPEETKKGDMQESYKFVFLIHTSST